MLMKLTPNLAQTCFFGDFEYAMGNLLSFLPIFFATQIIRGAKELVVIL